MKLQVSIRATHFNTEAQESTTTNDIFVRYNWESFGGPFDSGATKERPSGPRSLASGAKATSRSKKVAAS